MSLNIMDYSLLIGIHRVGDAETSHGEPAGPAGLGRIRRATHAYPPPRTGPVAAAPRRGPASRPVKGVCGATQQRKAE